MKTLMKQTESLLKNGYVTSRGKAYASGTAYSDTSDTSGVGRTTVTSAYIAGGGSSRLDDSTDDASDSVDEFAETIDWIAERMDEWGETIDKLNAELENTTTYLEKSQKIDEIIDASWGKYDDLIAGAEYYREYAQQFLDQLSGDYRTYAQNGAIEISDFTDEADEDIVDAIEDYRDYIQKAADLELEAEELITDIREWYTTKIDEAESSGSVKADVEASQTEKLQNAVDLDEEKGLIADPDYYVAMMENSERTVAYLTEARNNMQAAFDEAVRDGQLEVGSPDWYEELNKLYEIDAEIDEAVISIEEFQNAINDIYWDHFDELINEFDRVSEESQSLIDIMSSSDMFTKPDNENGWDADDVTWTDEGLATIGLHAQEMERAEAKAKAYAEAIDDLNKDYKAGLYSESEYKEKLDELTQGQYDAIKAAQDEKDAIVDLNKERIDAVKEGIEKQIDAYEELIDKKKEELEAERDLFDFRKSATEQNKNIADIERKLAALSADNSASAIAKRKQLEADLVEARQSREELYYERSIENQSDALDSELESFKEEKELEIEQLEAWLEDVEAIVAESLGIVQENATQIGETLTGMAEEYNLTVSDAVLSPWQEGANAISTYTTAFGDSVSATTKSFDTMKSNWSNVRSEIEAANNAASQYLSLTSTTPSVDTLLGENNGYITATYTPTTTPSTTPSTPSSTSSTSESSTPSVGGTVTVKSTATNFSANSGYAAMASFVPGGSYTVYQVSGSQVLIGRDGAYTGWVNLSDLQGYAKGTKGVKEDQLAWIDENGLEELVMHAGPDGRLQYLTKGTSVLNNELTDRIMNLAMNPQSVLDQNRPTIGLNPEIHNTEIRIDNSIGELIHIDKCDQGTLPDVQKIVDKALDKHMKDLNNSLKRFTRG